MRKVKDIPLPVDKAVKGKKIFYGKSFKHGYDVVIAHDDILKFLKKIPNEKFTLIVTSPPYNLGKPYEERLAFEKYLEWQREVVKECVRVLKPEGNICWEVGNFVKNGEIFPLDVYFYNILHDLNLKLRNRIIWHFGHGLHAKKRFSGRYETILWFTKSDDYVFNLDAVRVPQKYPGKRAYKGPNKGKPSGHPLGKNPADVWKTIVQDWENKLWYIPNVKANHPEKTIHPCQFPIELVERLVLALTNKDDIIFDPFVGVGSALVAGISHNRKVVGVDNFKAYTDIAYQRVIDALKGTLKRRPLGKPVYKPKGKEKVVRVPTEWKKIKKLTKFKHPRPE